jgi:hypothetical protein
MEKKKKKKKSRMSAEKVHRQLQDQVQALPYFIDQQKKEGKWFRAFVLRYISGPIWRTVNRILNARRYRGEAGQKLKQTEQMRRHLDHRKAAIKHMQDQMQSVQKKQRRTQ